MRSRALRLRSGASASALRDRRLRGRLAAGRRIPRRRGACDSAPMSGSRAARCGSTSASWAAAATRSRAARSSLDLPENYRFRFALRGKCRPNDLELKLIDQERRERVVVQPPRASTFPAKWDSLSTKKRQITFAWGPTGGGEIAPRRRDRVRDHGRAAAARARCGSTTSRSSRLPPPDAPRRRRRAPAPRRRARDTRPRARWTATRRSMWRSAPARSQRPGSRWISARSASTAGSSSTGREGFTPATTTSRSPPTTATGVRSAT